MSRYKNGYWILLGKYFSKWGQVIWTWILSYLLSECRRDSNPSYQWLSLTCSLWKKKKKSTYKTSIHKFFQLSAMNVTPTKKKKKNLLNSLPFQMLIWCKWSYEKCMPSWTWCCTTPNLSYRLALAQLKI